MHISTGIYKTITSAQSLILHFDFSSRQPLLITQIYEYLQNVACNHLTDIAAGYQGRGLSLYIRSLVGLARMTEPQYTYTLVCIRNGPT